MNDCTKTVTPADAGSLQSIVAALPEGAVLCLSAGVYQPVQLMVERSLTVRGIGDVVLDGRFRASTVQVNKPVDLVLESLTLKNGSGGGMGGGGNLFVFDGRSVTLRQVVLENGEADANGGGGLFVRGGTVVLDPANPDERAIEVGPEDDFAVLGVVCGVFRPFFEQEPAPEPEPAALP